MARLALNSESLKKGVLLKYFIIRVSREGHLAYIAEGAGPAPPKPSERPVCHQIHLRPDGAIVLSPMSIESMVGAIATYAVMSPGDLRCPEVPPFDSLDDAKAWVMDFSHEAHVENLERDIKVEQEKLMQYHSEGDELNAKRTERRLHKREETLKTYIST